MYLFRSLQPAARSTGSRTTGTGKSRTRHSGRSGATGRTRTGRSH